MRTRIPELFPENVRYREHAGKRSQVGRRGWPCVALAALDDATELIVLLPELCGEVLERD